MTKTPVAANALQALEVVGNGPSQITLYHDLLINDVVADEAEFLLIKVLGSPGGVNSGLLKYFFGSGRANSINVTQGIFYFLAVRYINSKQSGHNVYSVKLSFLRWRIASAF